MAQHVSGDLLLSCLPGEFWVTLCLDFLNLTWPYVENGSEGHEKFAILFWKVTKNKQKFYQKEGKETWKIQKRARGCNSTNTLICLGKLSRIFVFKIWKQLANWWYFATKPNSFIDTNMMSWLTWHSRIFFANSGISCHSFDWSFFKTDLSRFGGNVLKETRFISRLWGD